MGIFPRAATLLFLSLPEVKMESRAVDKRVYLVIIRDNFCPFCKKAYVVTPHLNHLAEMVQMRGHNIWFQGEIRKNS